MSDFMSVVILLIVIAFIAGAVILLATLVRHYKLMREDNHEQEVERLYQVGAKTERTRRIAIWSKRDEWGEAMCQLLDNRQIFEGMTSQMVQASWGSPSSIDRKTSNTERWVYDDPFQYDKYILFIDNKVSKVVS
jgi:hypothetical protein